MLIYLNGEITVTNASVAEIQDLVNETLGTSNANRFVSEGKVELSDYQCHGDDLDFLLEKAKEKGFVINGEVSWYGDDEGRYIIKDNEIEHLTIDECYLRDADDETLIAELKRRGFQVTKM